MAGLVTRSLTGSGFFFCTAGMLSAQHHPISVRRDSPPAEKQCPPKTPSQTTGLAHRQRLAVRSGRRSGRRSGQPADNQNQTGPRPALPSPAARGLAIRIYMRLGQLNPADSPLRYRSERDSRPLPKAIGPAPTVASPAPAKHGTADANPGRYTAGSAAQPPAKRRGLARRPGGFQ